MSTDPRQDRKVGSLTGIRQSSSQGRVTTGIYEDSSQAEFAR